MKKHPVGIITALVSIFLLILIFLLGQIKHQIKNELNVTLQNELTITKAHLQLWIKTNVQFAELIATHPSVIQYTQSLLQTESNTDSLIHNPAQLALRNLTAPWLANHSFEGFFIINQAGYNIASKYDENIGGKNTFMAQHSEMERLFYDHQPQWILPIKLEGLSGSHKTTHQIMMLLALPITDNAGNVIAILGLCIDPSADFTRIIKINREKKTDDSYAFNADGIAISGVRYESQLQAIGLLEKDQNAILTLNIRNPGGNIVQGYQPLTRIQQWPLTTMAYHAIQGQKGINIKGYLDYRGVPVVGAWLWDQQYHYGLAYEIDVEEAYQSYYIIRRVILTGFVFVVIIFISYTFMLLKRNTLIARVNKKQQQETHTLTTLLTATPDGVLFCNAEGQIISGNQQAEQLLGYTTQALKKLTIQKLIPKLHSINTAKTTDGTALLYAHQSDGTRLPVEVHETRVDQIDDITTIFIIHDISIRAEAIHLLQQRSNQLINQNKVLKSLSVSEEIRLPQFFDNITQKTAEALQISRVSLWFLDETRNLLKCKSLYNFDTKQHQQHDLVLKQSDYPHYFSALEQQRQIVAPQARTHPVTEQFTEYYFKPLHIMSLLDVALIEKSTLQGIICCEHCDQERHWNHEEQQFVLAIADIIMLAITTEQRIKIQHELQQHRTRLEEMVKERTDELKESEAFIREITHSANSAIIITHQDTGITFWNPAATSIFGWQEHDMLGKTFAPIIPTEKFKPGMGVIEFKAIKKDGTTFDAEISRSVFSRNSVQYTTHIINDISKRKQAERELKQKMNELQRFNLLTVSREHEMIRLKQEVNQLLESQGKQPKYTTNTPSQ